MLFTILADVVESGVVELTSGAYEQFITVLEAIDPELISGYVDKFVNWALGIITAFGGVFGYVTLKYNKMKLLLSREALTAEVKAEKAEALVEEIKHITTDMSHAFEVTMLKQGTRIDELTKDNELAAEMLQLIIKNGTLNPELLVEFGKILERVGDNSVLVGAEFGAALEEAKVKAEDTTSILDK
jgi:hypothetical protein